MLLCTQDSELYLNIFKYNWNLWICLFLGTSGGFHDSFPRISSRRSVHQKESFVRSVVFPVAVNHSVSRSDSLPPSAPRSRSRIANASRVGQTHFLPRSQHSNESRMHNAVLTAESRSDSLVLISQTKSRFTMVQWCKWLSINTTLTKFI